MKKIRMKGISNEERFNEITLEKSEIFLDNLQNFVLELGLVKIEKGVYTSEGKDYDMYTYYSLFDTDPRDDTEEKIKIEKFDDKILRYHNKDLELLIIFFESSIRILFYCDLKLREKVIKALEKFVEFK